MKLFILRQVRQTKLEIRISYKNMSHGNQDVEGSQTICLHETTPVLTLRATSNSLDDDANSNKNKGKDHNNVRWKQDVVDNEHMNKKKTKICCIYHPQESDEELDGNAESDDHFHLHRHENDEEYSDSDSSSSSESDNDKDLNKEERRRRRIIRRREKLNNETDYKTNAYEYQPKYPNKSSLRR